MDKRQTGGLARFLRQNPAVPFLVYFLVLFAFFCFVRLDLNDDALLAQRAFENGLLQETLSVTAGWSTRVVIDFVVFALYFPPPIVFILLQCGFAVLLAYSLGKLAMPQLNRQGAWLAVGVSCLYPLAQMQSAGWIATSCLYLWVVAAGLYAVVPWRLFLSGHKVPLHTWLLAVPAAFYASFSEQMAALLAGFFVIGCLWMLVKRTPPPVLAIVQAVVLFAILAFKLLGPGNAGRMAAEIEAFYPNYGAVPLVQKLYDCFMLVGDQFIGQGNLAMLFCCLFVCLAVFARHRDLFYRALAALPLAVCLLLGVLGPLLADLFPAFELIMERDLSADSFFRLSAHVAFLLYGAVWLCLLLGLWLAFPKKATGGMMAIVLAAGLASQMIMAIAPSLFVSRPRYFIYLYFALLLAGLVLVTDLFQREPGGKPARFAGVFIGVGAGASTLHLFLSQ